MKNLLDVINENKRLNIKTDEWGTLVLDTDVFGVMMLDKTIGQIQLYAGNNLEGLISDWEDQLDGFTIKDLKKMKSGETQEFGSGNFLLVKF